jgi:MFS family permease
MSIITRVIFVLSLVSLFTDMASEMLYPVMPVYLQSIGYSVIVIGLIEGFAEAMAGLSKGYFGNLSDLSGKRMPFVRIGYMLSAISKPLLGLLTNAWWIFGSRMLDRLGKGIRTGARDAVLSDASHASHKGKVFGFHRAIDTLGAVLGPLLALAWLSAHPGDYRTLFFIAFLPGIVAVALTFILKEHHQNPAHTARRPGFLEFAGYWKRGPKAYKHLTAGLLLFFLFNSSDVFLLLRLKSITGSDADVIYAYIFYNLVYALAAYPLGVLADRIGLKAVLSGGLFLFAGVYFGMAYADTQTEFLVLFFCYGIYAAATEGVAKAWISNIAERKDTATAIGAFSAFQSISLLIASSTAGLLWYFAGPATTFLLTAIMATVAAFIIWRIRTGDGGFKVQGSKFKVD